MTVSTTLDRQYFSGDGANHNFPFNFRFFANTQISVTVVGPAPTYTLTPLVENVGYTLTGAGLDTGGTVVTTAAVAVGSNNLLVQRTLPVVQPVSIRNQGNFFASIHENVFDYLTMLIQQAINAAISALKLDASGNFWDFKGKIGANAADPVNPQDVATKNWVGLFVDGVSGAINTTVGIAYDAGTLFDYLKTGANRTCDSVSALRLLASTRNQRAFVLGHGSKGDGGGGHYWADMSDTTSADTNGDIIVGVGGIRWKLIITRALDVRQFGAKADDEAGAGTDSFAAIQRTIDRAVALKIGEVYAPGKYKILDTLVVNTGAFTQSISIRGDGSTSQIRQAGVGKDAIWWSTTQFLRNCWIKDIAIYCEDTAGHGINIKFGCTVCRFENVNVTVLNTVKSCYIGSYVGFALGDPCGVFDTIWDGGDLYVTSLHTAFGIDFVAKGTVFNENTFRNLRCSNAGITQFFRIINTDNNTYLTNNKFSNINFEICSGGGILAYNARGWLLENITFWDTPAYTNHLIMFATNTGLFGLSNTLINIFRNGDVLTAGAKDILIQYAEDTVVINCYTPGGSYDWSNRRVYVTGLKLPTEVNVAGRIYTNLTSSITGACSIIGATADVLMAENLTPSRTGVGVYRFTFPFAKGTTTYRAHASISTGTVGWAQCNKQLGYVDVTCLNSAGSAFDPAVVDITIIG